MSKNKIILVTGTSSGFGKLTAFNLAQDGHVVYASMRETNGRNKIIKEEILNHAKVNNLNLEVIELDVTNEESINFAIKTIIEKNDKIDVVINNAGIGAAGPVECYSTNQVKKIYEVNVFGPLRVNRAVLPYMRKEKSGLIIYITSTGGRLLIPFLGIYSSSKFALEALAEAYNFELSKFGIDTSIVEPGAFLTNIQSSMMSSDDIKRIKEYKEISIISKKMYKELGEALSSSNAPNPTDVAKEIKKLVDMPQGQRPLRSVVGSIGIKGVKQLNDLSEKVQKEYINDLTIGYLK